MKQVLIFITLLSLAMHISAAGWLTSNSSAVINHINIEGGLVRIKYTATDIADPDKCGNEGAAILLDDTKNGDRQYAALLAAHMSGKAIRLYGNGCFTGWDQTWPKIHAVFIY